MEVANASNGVLECRVIAESSDSERWRAVLIVDDKYAGRLLSMRIADGSKQPIPDGFVDVVVGEGRREVEVVVQIGGDYYVVPIQVPRARPTLQASVAAGEGRKLKRESLEAQYRASVEAYEQRVAEHNRMARGGR
jgi:hypothetical protein